MTVREQKTALVTGASAGIGAAVARRLARDGYAVAVNARTEARAMVTVEQIRSDGGRAVPVAADISDSEVLGEMFDTIDSELGSLDLVVNNAGMATIQESEDVPLRRWDRVLALNLTAPFLISQLAYPRLLQQGGGTIINVASIYGVIASGRRAAYVSSKHGLIGLTKALAVEWAPSNVRVLAVTPSYIDTEIIVNARESGNFDPAGVLDRTPMGRLGTVEEVADVIAFAASKDARYMTGSNILVDGGWLAFGGA